jgi:arylsulfatase A-like enzyme
MSRRQFLGTTLCGAAGAAVGWSLLDALTRPAAGAVGDRPNVLFIAIDDLNDWVGHLEGHPQARTPNLDALADRGVAFTNAHCTAPACNPSRASLLTGIRPSTSGVYLNTQPWRPAMPDAVTLPLLFREGGYEVNGRGKIFHGRFPDDDSSWDEYIPRGGDPMPDRERRPLNGIPDAGNFDWGPLDVPEEEMDDAKVAAWCVEQIEGGFERPFFLACGIFRPHLQWYAPRKYFDLFPEDEIILPNVKDDDLDDVPPIGRRFAENGDHPRVIATNTWASAVQAYLACGAFADAQVGRVLDALYASPYAENTIVVLWGDHGWHLGEKLHWRKFALWEEATRAPLIFAAPGVTGAGGRCARAVSFLDIYPTLVDLCGLTPPPEQLEGETMRPLLADPAAPWEKPALTTHGRGNHSVRSEAWRYTRYRDGTEELYDEINDPLEWTNLAGEPRFDHVKRELARWLPQSDAPDAPRKAPEHSAQLLEHLRDALQDDRLDLGAEGQASVVIKRAVHLVASADDGACGRDVADHPVGVRGHDRALEGRVALDPQCVLHQHLAREADDHGRPDTQRRGLQRAREDVRLDGRQFEELLAPPDAPAEDLLEDRVAGRLGIGALLAECGDLRRDLIRGRRVLQRHLDGAAHRRKRDPGDRLGPLHRADDRPGDLIPAAAHLLECPRSRADCVDVTAASLREHRRASGVDGLDRGLCRAGPVGGDQVVVPAEHDRMCRVAEPRREERPGLIAHGHHVHPRGQRPPQGRALQRLLLQHLAAVVPHRGLRSGESDGGGPQLRGGDLRDGDELRREDVEVLLINEVVAEHTVCQRPRVRVRVAHKHVRGGDARGRLDARADGIDVLVVEADHVAGDEQQRGVTGRQRQRFRVQRIMDALGTVLARRVAAHEGSQRRRDVDHRRAGAEP